jgi:hypothetical protein
MRLVNKTPASQPFSSGCRAQTVPRRLNAMFVPPLTSLTTLQGAGRSGQRTCGPAARAPLGDARGPGPARLGLHKRTRLRVHARPPRRGRLLQCPLSHLAALSLCRSQTQTASGRTRPRPMRRVPRYPRCRTCRHPWSAACCTAAKAWQVRRAGGAPACLHAPGPRAVEGGCRGWMAASWQCSLPGLRDDGRSQQVHRSGRCTPRRTDRIPPRRASPPLQRPVPPRRPAPRRGDARRRAAAVSPTRACGGIEAKMPLTAGKLHTLW